MNDATASEPNASTPPYDGPHYGFGEDNHIAHEIVSFDPLYDTPGAVETSRMGERSSPLTPTLDSLPPCMREPILSELAGLTGEHREAREAELVHAALLQHSLDFRIAAGPGPNADPYRRAVFDVANRQRLADQSIAKITAELAEIAGYDSVVNPATGQREPKPIYAVSGAQRHALNLRLAELQMEKSALAGPLGEREREAALKEAIAQRKGIMAQVEEEAEVRRRSEHIARERRINERAEALAKGKRTEW